MVGAVAQGEEPGHQRPALLLSGAIPKLSGHRPQNVRLQVRKYVLARSLVFLTTKLLTHGTHFRQTTIFSFDFGVPLNLLIFFIPSGNI